MKRLMLIAVVIHVGSGLVARRIGILRLGSAGWWFRWFLSASPWLRLRGSVAADGIDHSMVSLLPAISAFGRENFTGFMLPGNAIVITGEWEHRRHFGNEGIASCATAGHGLRDILLVMAARSFAIALVAVMMFCTVLLLICPVTLGPYSATHGPATALRSMRLSALVIFGMLLAATSLMGNFSVPALLRNSLPATVVILPPEGHDTRACSQLRC